MLARRTLQATARIAVGSSSSATVGASCSAPSASFSTSSTTQAESKARRKARLTRKAHQDKKLALRRTDEQTRPDPVLGYPREQGGQFSPTSTDATAAAWDNSLLKRVVVDRETIWNSPAPPAPVPGITTEPYVPSHLNFNLSAQDAELLSSTLPAVSSLRTLLGASPANAAIAERRAEKSEVIEADKRDKIMRIIDLRNADSKGIDVENRRRIAKAFSADGETETDTGRPEVQAALLTYRIRSLLTHLVAQPRDVTNRRPLRSLIHQRAKVLKYLRAVDVKRYDDCLTQIGVEPRAVEGEVIVTKKGLRELVKGV